MTAPVSTWARDPLGTAWQGFTHLVAGWVHPLVLAGVGAGLLGAVLAAWGPSRRLVVRVGHRLRLRVCWRRAVHHAGALGTDEARPRIRGIAAIPAGDRIRVELPHGSHAGELEKAAEAIATSMSVREIRVLRDRADARTAWVDVVRRDPLSGGPPLRSPLIDAYRISFWDPIPFGVGEDGAGVGVGLPGRHLLIGGETGGGKSAVMNGVCAAAGLDPRVLLSLFDGKLVELSPWRGVAEHFVGVDINQAIAVLREIRSDMESRYGFLLDLGRRKIGPDDEAFPLRLVAIDELAVYTAAPGAERNAVKEFAGLTRDIVSRGRAAGIVVMAATQKPSADVVPTSLRDLFGFRFAVRCANRDASDTILGAGWATHGYSAATIDAADRGVGYLLHEGGTPVRVRSYYLDDDDVKAIASRAKALRSGQEVVA